MFNWFKRDKKVAKGPDFSSVESQAQAVALFEQGILQKLLLMPAEFGGQDNALNVVYVPAAAVEAKASLDHNVVRPLLDERKVTRYQASPKYEGKSFVPSSITITATEPGSFSATIAIWGEALREGEAR